MTDWTTARVVRDRDGDLWGRGRSGWTMLHSTWAGRAGHNDTLLAGWGPLTPVLDADGLPVVRTVGDLTARHVGRAVRVPFVGIDLDYRLVGMRYVGAGHVEYTLDPLGDDGMEGVVAYPLDAPCELLPEGDA